MKAMRLLAVSALLCLSYVNMWGQMAEWVIPPVYDNMYVAEGTELVITDSLAKMRGVWSFDGRRLSGNDMDINGFRDGVAVCTRRGLNQISGILSAPEGKFTAVPAALFTTFQYPFYSCGYLLLLKENGQYVFLDNYGKRESSEYAGAYPFCNGYASCRAFEYPEKMKDMYCALLSQDLETMPIEYNGKQIEPKDIDYLSSVCEDGLAVVVYRKKVFTYDVNTHALNPLCLNSNETGTKTQVKVSGELSQFLISDGNSGYVLSANHGKKGTVTIKLDAFAVPTAIQYVDSEREFKKTARQVEPLVSVYQSFKEGAMYGVRWLSEEVLPAQFDELPFFFGDNAIVRKDGKYGLLKLHLDNQFQITVNKGKDIPFKHQTFETTIRLNLPLFIQAEKASLEIDPSSGLEIDKTSEEMKNTPYGNFVQYDCTLHIPEVLSDNEITELAYPVRVKYNGLVSSELKLRLKAWHYKYFVVDVGEYEIDNGDLSFTFNINATREPGDDIYPIDVVVAADSLEIEKEKLSESRYKCKTKHLAEGQNVVTVQVTEQGCPPVLFPFEVFYTKPVAESVDQPEVKEEVVIKKQEKKPKKAAIVEPHVEM